jgi:hypothetical protein
MRADWVFSSKDGRPHEANWAAVAQRPLASARRQRPLKLVTGIFLVLSPLVSAMARGAEVEVSATANLPEGIVVFGDSQAQGLALALSAMLRGSKGYKVFNRAKPNTGLSQVSTYNWPVAIGRFSNREHAAVAIMMFGANDWMPLRDPSGRWTKFGTAKWEEYYRERAIMICKSVTAKGLEVIWVGDPISLRPSYSEAMKFLNKIYEEAAASTGSVYLDTWSVPSNDTANTAGDHAKLYAADGIHFTSVGYKLIASRVVPLLQPQNNGSEQNGQARIAH